MPTAVAAFSMGTAKPMPTKKLCFVGLRIAVTMPTTSPRAVTSGPPELPGLAAASNWMRLVSKRFPFGEKNSRRNPETTPALAEGPMPKGIADGDNLIAYGKVRGGAHGGRDQIVGNLMRLKHGQIMLRLHTGHGGVGFEPVSEHDLHPLGAEYHMEIGQDQALVDDHDAGADALFALFAVLVRFHPTYPDDRRSNDLERFCRRGRQNIGLERVQHCGANIFLSDRTRRRRE